MTMAEALVALAGQRQTELDIEIASWRTDLAATTRIWCGPGCGNCCTLTVNTTFPEALALAMHLDENQRLLVGAASARVAAHARANAGNVRTFLSGYRQAVGPCPFLDHEGNCTVYPLRPLACRALLATRPPQWCGINLATLPGLERNHFLESLDRSVVAFPTHYAAAPQEIAERIEQGLIFAMLRTHGFGVTGNLPVLVNLAGQAEFIVSIEEGPAALRTFLAEHDLAHPFLIQLHEP